MNDQLNNIQTFPKWNHVEPSTQKGYTVFFGNWGTYYAEMTKQQLLHFYRTFLKNSQFATFGDLYLYNDGKLFRSINWNNQRACITKTITA
jgi:hypothetical protein